MPGHAEPFDGSWQATASMSDDKGGDGALSRVPAWDCSPMTWRAFKRELACWTSSLDFESSGALKSTTLLPGGC